jgi:hypothetical protein
MEALDHEFCLKFLACGVRVSGSSDMVRPESRVSVADAGDMLTTKVELRQICCQSMREENFNKFAGSLGSTRVASLCCFTYPSTSGCAAQMYTHTNVTNYTTVRLAVFSHCTSQLCLHAHLHRDKSRDLDLDSSVVLCRCNGIGKSVTIKGN